MLGDDGNDLLALLVFMPCVPKAALVPFDWTHL